MSMDSEHTTGTLLGMIIGLIKAMLEVSVFGLLSWELIFETAILAGVGGAFGYAGAEILRYIKNIFKRK